MPWTPPPVGARATWTRTFGADEVEGYARLTGDRNPLHVDDAFAGATKPITRLRCTARRDDGTEVLRGECVVSTMQAE